MGRTLACADLHGRYDLFAQIQNFLKPDDKLFIIGDVFDRGPDGWKIYKAIKEDARITLLMGNHEQMAAYGLDEWLNYSGGDWSLSIWIDHNGGQPTFDAILKDFDIPQFVDSFSPETELKIRKLVAELRGLPVKHEYTNKDNIRIRLVHSGYWSVWVDDCIWDRRHLYTERSWEGPQNEIIVHGHTPISLLIKDFKKENLFTKEIKEYTDGALWYCDSHKIDLDTAARWSGQTVVLDLDTFDEHIFQGEPYDGKK